MNLELNNFLEAHAPLFEKGLGEDNWYIVTLAALTSGRYFTTAAGAIYRYQTKRPEYSTELQRQALIRRLRETLVKLVVITGIPKALAGIISLATAIEPGDNDMTFSREGWHPTEVAARGETMNARIYQGDADLGFRLLLPHRDFTFVIKDVVYGLFLSEDSVLSNQEAEMAVLPSILMQNIPLESIGHIKGMLRLGIDRDHLGRIISSVKVIAQFMDLDIPDMSVPETW